MQSAHYIWQLPRWTEGFQWDASRLLPLIGTTRRRQGRILGQAASLGPDVRSGVRASVLAKLRVDVLAEEAIASSAIESERLGEPSVRSAITRQLGMIIDGARPAERHVDGFVEVLLDATTNHSAPLTVSRLQGWQAALFPSGFSGINRIAVGAWRRHRTSMIRIPFLSGDAEICYEAPPADVVSQEMERFLDWWEASAESEEGLVRAGIAHFWFVSIHPFDDGSGRIGRAITDMALAQDEQSPIRLYGLSSQILDERHAYCSALKEAQTSNGDLTGWLCWFLECLERAMARAEGRIERALARTRFWQCHGGVALNERQLTVPNMLLDAGPDGIDGGLCTRKYVRMTRASRATAQREIANMVRQGLLVQRPGGGRSTSYEAAWKMSGPGPSSR